MPEATEPEPPDEETIKKRVEEFKRLHQILMIEYEVRQQNTLEHPMFHRLKDVLRDTNPEGITDDLWKQTLKYYGEQRDFSNVLQWVNSRIDQYMRILEDLEGPKPPPPTPSPEQVKQHTRVVMAFLTKVTKYDIMQLIDTSMSPSKINQIAVKNARALFHKYVQYSKARAQELQLGGPYKLIDLNAFEEVCEKVGWERTRVPKEPSRKRRRKPTAKELQEAGREEEAEAARKKKTQNNSGADSGREVQSSPSLGCEILLLE